jgi:hypothetical protein
MAMRSFLISALLFVAVGISAAEAPVVSTPLETVELPADSRDWDTVGSFTLKNATTTTTVWLYHSNENTITRKKADRAGENSYFFTSHPSCAFHAIYRIGDGPWKYRELYSGCRVGVHGIGEIQPASVQIRTSFLAMRWWYEPEPEPGTMILEVIDGVPALAWAPTH